MGAVSEPLIQWFELNRRLLPFRSRQQVYLLLSAAIDFNVTQVVDITPKAFTV